MTITDPPFCTRCKTYMWTTDLSPMFRCHCVRDERYWKEEKGEWDGIMKNLRKELFTVTIRC